MMEILSQRINLYCLEKINALFYNQSKKIFEIYLNWFLRTNNRGLYPKNNMNEGKLKLQAMRKMLKKNNDNNALPEKAKPEQQNAQQHQDQARRQQNQQKQNISHQNESNTAIAIQPREKTPIQKNSHEPVVNKEEKKPDVKQIRQQGEVEDEQSAEQNIEKQRQQRYQSQTEKRQSDNSSNQNIEENNHVDENIQQKGDMIEEQKEMQQNDQQVDEQNQNQLQENSHNNLTNNNQENHEHLLHNTLSHNQKAPANDLCIEKQQNTQQLPTIPTSEPQQSHSTHLTQSQDHTNNLFQPKTQTNTQPKPTFFPPPPSTAKPSPPPQPSKPAFKVILKQLQMIKSSIHNLAVTYRGVEFLRQEIKRDSQLKKRLKERIEEYGRDDECEVLRKIVKKTLESGDGQAEISMGQRQQRPHSNVNMVQEKNVQKSRETIQNQEEGLQSKEMIQA